MTFLFLAWTILGVFAASCASVVFYISIQHDQFLDRIFNWQDNLDKWGSKSGLWNEIKHKALGGCKFCFSHFTTVLTFVFFVLFVSLNGEWFHSPNLFVAIISNIIFYLLFIVSGTVMSFLMLTKWIKE